MVDRVSSIGILLLGYEYLEAAYILLNAEKREVSYPRLFLFSHAIELGFKAFLLEHTNELVRGHNLMDLLKKAQISGFVARPIFLSIIQTFTELNNDENRMRYFKDGFVSFPNNQILVEETKIFYEFLVTKISDPHRILERKVIFPIKGINWITRTSRVMTG